MNYDWTPMNDPPDNGREVLFHYEFKKNGRKGWFPAWYFNNRGWIVSAGGYEVREFLSNRRFKGHWKDVKPPE